MKDHVISRTVALVAALMFVLSATVSVASSAGTDIPAIVSKLRASTMGVDRGGNLWTWDGVRVTRLDPNGNEVVVMIPDASAIDADEELGIVALMKGGHEVRLLSWDGKFVDSFSIPSEAARVSWMESPKVAIATRFSDHRVEVWDTHTHTLVRNLSETNAVSTTPGAHPAHTTLIRYDASHHELFALDSFLGDLSVFDDTGKLVRHTTIANPHQDEWTAWLATTDRNARTEGRSFTPSLWGFPSMTLTPDGSAWLGERVQGSKVGTVQVTRSGEVKRATFTEAQCPSLTFEAWQGFFVFYRDPKSPQPACAGARRQ